VTLLENSWEAAKLEKVWGSRIPVTETAMKKVKKILTTPLARPILPEVNLLENSL